MKSSRFFMAAFAALLLTAPALAAGPATFPLGAQNSSGETGSATFTQKGDDVIVVVKVEGGNAKGPQPVHIHKGTCAHLNPTPFLPLTSIVGGTSTTSFENTTVEKMTTGNVYSINIHKSPAEAKIYTACGRLRATAKM